MKIFKAGVPYHEWKIEELREELHKDRKFAVEYLKAAFESLENPEDLGGSLLMLRAVAEAYGSISAVAAQAGVTRESLYHALSPRGNPTLKTLVGVLKALNLRLTVARRAKTKKKTRASRKLAV